MGVFLADFKESEKLPAQLACTPEPLRVMDRARKGLADLLASKETTR